MMDRRVEPSLWTFYLEEQKRSCTVSLDLYKEKICARSEKSGRQVCEGGAGQVCLTFNGEDQVKKEAWWNMMFTDDIVITGWRCVVVLQLLVTFLLSYCGTLALI